jgi:hypothetical protein
VVTYRGSHSQNAAKSHPIGNLKGSLLPHRQTVEFSYAIFASGAQADALAAMTNRYPRPRGGAADGLGDF